MGSTLHLCQHLLLDSFSEGSHFIKDVLDTDTHLLDGIKSIHKSLFFTVLKKRIGVVE